MSDLIVGPDGIERTPEAHGAVVDGAIRDLETLGLVEPFRRVDGQIAYRCTEKGRQYGKASRAEREGQA